MRDAVAATTFEEAEKLVASGRLSEIVAVGGGAAASIDNGAGSRDEVWVGVVAKAFTAECDCCPDGDQDELCAHAVAVIVAALQDDFLWSSAATPPSQETVDPKVQRLADIAATLSVRRLSTMVAEHAVTDRRLETRLLAYAGKLGPLDEVEAAEVRRTIDNLASEATVGDWQVHDVLQAGRWIVDELEVLVQRPVNETALSLVEHAAVVWDELVSNLYDADASYTEEADETGDAVRAVHIRMCHELQLAPDDLVERLRSLIGEADVTACLDEPEDYLHLVGAAGVAALCR